MRLTRSETFAEAKELVRGSTWKVSLANETGCKLLLHCVACKSSAIRYLEYVRQGYGCRCQSGTKISAAVSLSTKEFLARVPSTVDVLGKYAKLNDIIKARCKECGTIWYPWARNLAKGHQCKCVGRTMNRATCMKKYGVASASQSPSVQRKMRRTMRKRYGVDHALQNRELFDKNLTTAYKYKKYRLGKRVVKVQGFEPLALDYLIYTKGLSPNHIQCGIGNEAVPTVAYVFDGKTRVYHPDIFVPHTNTVYEVKSDYTYKVDLKRNRAKRKACKTQGYRFVFLVMNSDGTRYDHRTN